LLQVPERRSGLKRRKVMKANFRMLAATFGARLRP
jgi:hypothetical protein